MSKNHQHKGYGNYLIGSAVGKVIVVAENVGIIGLFVDAKDNYVKEYYETFGFVSLLGDPLILFLPIQTLLQFK